MAAQRAYVSVSGIPHSAVSTGRKVELFRVRPQERDDERVNGWQAQPEGARGERRVKREELDAFKALEHPAHRRACSWFLDLIGNGLRCLSQARP